jgi:16S rRNA processing protein RimM
MAGKVLPLDAVDLPPDAIEVGRIADAFGVKGWFKILPHSASPEALFSSKRWYLLPSERGVPAFSGTVLLRIQEAKTHADTLVASAHDITDRDIAQLLKGARVFVSRASFPTAGTDEYYWVDLIGLDVVNREGVPFGTVRELLSTGAQTVLVTVLPKNPEAKSDEPDSEDQERMIPFVSVYIDNVDLPGRRITVDWQPDY